MRRRHHPWLIISVIVIAAVIAAVVAGGALKDVSTPNLLPGATAPTPTLNFVARLIPATHQGQARHLRLIPKATSVTIATSAYNNCINTGTQCRQSLLQQINGDRALVGSAPLALDSVMVHGTTGCMGAAGNAVRMARQGFIDHGAFPGDVCGFPSVYHGIGENVGASSGLSKENAIMVVHQAMMSEPYTPGCQSNHHCNLLYPGYTHMGISFAQSGGVWYVAEEFGG